ncbi:MAG TPA: hypothetical protein VFO89_06975, partial [Thermoanaerobaculia bacterium]|nr:hypothetical protein [Thermoanaerobaculia bacterium]
RAEVTGAPSARRSRTLRAHMPRLVRVLLLLLAALAVVHAARTVWRQNERAAGLDFYIYFVNSQLAARDDIENIYAPETQSRVGEEYYARAQSTQSELRRYDANRRRRLDNVSSPFLYTTLSWVSRDYDKALRQYHAVVLFAFIGGTLLLAWRASIKPWLVLFLVAALLYWYRGFEADLRVGNVNALQLLAIGAMLAIAPRPPEDATNPPTGTRRGTIVRTILSAALLGALLAIKPNVIAVVALVAVSRVVTRNGPRLKLELLGGAIGGLTAFVVTSIHYGTPRVWLQWLTAANQFWHRLPTRMERNIAPALSWIDAYGTWVSYAIAALLFAIVCMALAKRKRADDLLLVSAGLLIYLLSATVVWLHYLVLAIPAAIALLRWRGTAIVAILALLLMAEEPFEMTIGVQAFPIETWLITPSLVALFVCVVWKIVTPPPLPDPSLALGVV